MRIQGLLLAAGESTRFGRDKLMQELVGGVPVAVAAAMCLAAVVPDTYAVIRPRDRELARRLTAAGIGVLPCRTAGRGMGASLACGVGATRDADAWIVALADMPCIAPETVLAVREQLQRGAPLAAPVYRGRRGHPVGFEHAFGDSLAALSGDRGARDIIHRHQRRLVRIAVDDPGAVLDIDTPEDLMKVPPPERRRFV